MNELKTEAAQEIVALLPCAHLCFPLQAFDTQVSVDYGCLFIIIQGHRTR